MEGKRRIDFVVTGYIFNKDKLLLIHHAKLDKWLPVGGHIEANETPDEAIFREIKEETGLDIELIGKPDMPSEGNVKEHLTTPFYVNVHSVGDHDHCSFFYICKAINPEGLKINKELKGFKWVSKEELEQDFIPPDVKHIALKAFSLI